MHYKSNIKFQPTYTIIQLKKRAKAQNNGTGAQLEIKTLMSSLLYAIVPTIWCLGSQGVCAFYVMRLTN
jgi:hypothetical protein